MNEDWDCIKFTGDVAFKNLEEAENLVKNYDHYQKYGFGRWPVLDKVSGEFLGWCGLKYDEELEEYDLGFRFLKRHWGKGYATEGAKAALEYAFNNLKLNKVVSFTADSNIPSESVMKKLGMTKVGEFNHPKLTSGHHLEKHVLYEILNPYLT